MQHTPHGSTRDDPGFQRFPVLTIGIHACDLDEAAASILRLASKGERGYVTVTGVHGVIESFHDARISDAHNSALLNLPDGMPMVWVGRRKGLAIRRVGGPDLMAKVFEAGRSKAGIRHFLCGGKEGVADALSRAMSERFPGSEIVGTYCPPFRALTDQEKSQLAQRIRDSGSNLIWIGLSTPKQELFMKDLVALIPSGILLGVGAAFDFHIGAIPRAPSWMQQSGLEWLFRLASEPKRLWRRYLKIVPEFIGLHALEIMGASFQGRHARRESVPPGGA